MMFSFEQSLPQSKLLLIDKILKEGGKISNEEYPTKKSRRRNFRKSYKKKISKSSKILIAIHLVIRKNFYKFKGVIA